MVSAQSNEGSTQSAFIAMLKTSSRKIVAIGASLGVWLRAVERIVFTKEVSHLPDAKLIQELTDLLLAAETTKPRLND